MADETPATKLACLSHNRTGYATLVLILDRETGCWDLAGAGIKAGEVASGAEALLQLARSALEEDTCTCGGCAARLAWVRRALGTLSPDLPPSRRAGLH